MAFMASEILGFVPVSTLMPYSHCMGLGTGRGPETVDFYNMLCTVHTSQGQGQGQGMGTGTIGFHTHFPVPSPIQGPIPCLTPVTWLV